MDNDEIVRLNVGGTKYVTMKSTLRKYPESMLGSMFNGHISLPEDKNGYYFIDRCAHIFEHVLQFLRCGKLLLPEGFNELDLLQIEANFYQIKELISAVAHRKERVMAKKIYELPLVILLVTHKAGSVIFKMLKRSNDGKFECVHSRNIFHACVGEIKRQLVSDSWVLAESKKLNGEDFGAFVLVHNLGDNIYDSKIISADVEMWFRNPGVAFL